MRPRFDAPGERAPHALPPASETLRDAPAVASLFLGVLSRDLNGFFPRSILERLDDAEPNLRNGPNFRLVHGTPEDGDRIELYGVAYRLVVREGEPATEQE